MKKMKLLTAVLFCLGIAGLASAGEVINIDLNGYGNSVAYTGSAAVSGASTTWNVYYGMWGKPMGSPSSGWLRDYNDPCYPTKHASQVWIGDNGENHGYLWGTGIGLMDDGFEKTAGAPEDPCIRLWGTTVASQGYGGTYDIYVYGNDPCGGFTLRRNTASSTLSLDGNDHVIFQNVNISSDPNYVTISYTKQINALQLVRLKNPVVVEGNDTYISGPEYDVAFETNIKPEGGEYQRFGPDVNDVCNLVMTIDKGEYMDYDIYVPEANEGEYEVRYEISSNEEVWIECYLDDLFLGTVTHASTAETGDTDKYFEWTDPPFVVKIFNGPHTIRWSSANGGYGFNVRQIRLHRIGDANMVDCNEVYKYSRNLEKDLAGGTQIGSYPTPAFPGHRPILYTYHDCHVDFNDLEAVVDHWLDCYDPDPNGPCL